MYLSEFIFRIGKILIQTNWDSGEPELYYLRLPKDIKDYQVYQGLLSFDQGLLVNYQGLPGNLQGPPGNYKGIQGNY